MILALISEEGCFCIDSESTANTLMQYSGVNF